jgi:hypothetical protein
LKGERFGFWDRGNFRNGGGFGSRRGLQRRRLQNTLGYGGLRGYRGGKLFLRLWFERDFR